jgi:hypothetical protein
MKYRLTALIILFSLILTACSLAEDLTPPPDYISSTTIPRSASPTQPQQTTSTKVPTAITPEFSPSPSLLPTLSNSDTTPTATPLGNITGTLVNGSGGSIPQGQKVRLVAFDMDQSGSYQKALELEASVDSAGLYGFKGVDLRQDRAFLVMTSWGGIEYQSDPVTISDATTDFSVPITIYEKTDDLKNLAFNQVHLIFESSSQNVLQVTELFIVSNPGKMAVVVSSDGTTIPFIQIPTGASSVQYQLSQGSAQLLNATGGFAMIPGVGKQYGFIASYTMPYSRGLKFDQPFSIPVSSLTVFIPIGMRLRGEQLTGAGEQNIQGQSYQMFQANDIASGSSLSLSLSGKQGASSGLTLSRQTLVLIGIGVVGVLLIGLGIYLYFRDRARFKRENEAASMTDSEEIGKDSLGDDRSNIMDAMIALDDQYKAGEISKEAYATRRSELKERLKQTL